MRIVIWRMWRAFPEFDALTDTECRSLLGRGYARSPAIMYRLPTIMFFVSLMAFPALLVVVLTRSWATKLAWLIPDVPIATYGIMIIATVSFSAMSSLLVRDVVMWRVLRGEIDRAHCPKCKQSLMGLRIDSPGVTPDPAQNKVRCPECGRVWKLLDIGLTPRDLVPWEQRGMPTDVGRKLEQRREYSKEQK